MDPLEPGPFRNLLFHLVMNPDQPAVIDQLGDGMATLSFPTSRTFALVVRYRPGAAGELAGALKSSVRALYRRASALGKSTGASCAVVMVGGPDSVRSMLKRAHPVLTRFRIPTYQVSDGGAVWSSREARSMGFLRPQLDALASRPEPSAGDWQAFARVVEERGDEHAAEAKTLSAFAEHMRGKRMYATITLIAVMVVVFVLEHLWGGTESALTLRRMGALAPERVRDGEVWRLISCTFLHAGAMHLVFNMLVLAILGSSLERILGTRRFLVLYGVSAIGGSLASFLFLGPRFSVGASGAVWGLLAAEAVLAYRPQGLLPDAMIPRAKRVTAINLAINVLNSFRPNVDMYGHFGGGAAGALLMVSGLLGAGLPRWDGNQPATKDSPAGAPSWLTGAAAAVALVLAAGLTAGVVAGRAWTIGEPSAMVAHDLPEIGVSVVVPEEVLGHRTLTEEEDVVTVSLGDPLARPVALDITRISFESAIPDDEVDAVIASIETEFTRLSDPNLAGAKLGRAPTRTTLGGRPAVLVEYELPSGVRLERGIVLVDAALIRVDAVVWPSAGASNDGLAGKILASLQPLGPPR